MDQLSKTDKNLLVAFMGEAEANRKYTAYAMKAMEEGHPEVAQVFLEAAGSETVHALSHLRVLGIRDTLENLKAVVEAEANDESMYARMIQEAQEEGREDAVRTFRLAGEREQYHHRMFQEVLGQFQGAAPAAAPAPGESRPLQPTEGPLATGHMEREMLEKEKGRVAGRSRIREVVFGSQDGLISTAALVAGVYAGSAQNTTFVLIAGMAGAFAGMLSMGAGAYLSSRAEREVLLTEIAQERQEIEKYPLEEMAELVALYQREGMPKDKAQSLAQRLSSSRELLLEALSAKELGVNLGQVAEMNPLKDGAVMGVAYILGAVIPIIPFLFTGGRPALLVALGLTVAGLFAIGLSKAWVGRRRWLVSGLEVLGVGLGVAMAGYLLGTVLPGLLGLGAAFQP